MAASVMDVGYMASATARVDGRANESAERRQFRESEIGQALSEFQDDYR